MAERDILYAIRLTLGADPRVVLWRNPIGFYKEQGRAIRYGVGGAGGSDLIGILRPSGRWFALEVKTETGVASTEQAMFLDLIRRAGGWGSIVRSVAEAKASLEAALRGES
ncbi:MAG: hypothetical protein WC700_16260 [Gemmatimonadaceae bacterium]|jgi:hypothetical protein